MIDLDTKTLNSIIQTIENFSEVKEALIFGSRVTGNAKSGSDIDIALKGSLDLNVIRKISYLLNEEGTLPYFFDIVHYDTLDNRALIEHIDAYGKVIFTAK